MSNQVRGLHCRCLKNRCGDSRKLRHNITDSILSWAKSLGAPFCSSCQIKASGSAIRTREWVAIKIIGEPGGKRWGGGFAPCAPERPEANKEQGWDERFATPCGPCSVQALAREPCDRNPSRHLKKIPGEFVGPARCRHIKKTSIKSGLFYMAEGVGFEPTRPVRACRFSRPVPSTARPPFRASGRLYSYLLCLAIKTAYFLLIQSNPGYRTEVNILIPGPLKSLDCCNSCRSSGYNVVY